MKYSILIVLFTSILIPVSAQFSVAGSDSLLSKPLTIAYSLEIKSEKKSGVAESYNGAIKTIFLGDKMARSRMVSLMRVQSIFYSQLKEMPVITIVKESGARYKRVLDDKGWKKMNEQYNEVQYEYLADSVKILDYMCKKVQLRMKGNKFITAYYTSQLQHPLFGKIEPAFDGVPGIVLKYEYVNGNAGFTYTATDVSFNPVAADTYKIP